jgi:hypothetical protein
LAGTDRKDALIALLRKQGRGQFETMAAYMEYIRQDGQEQLKRFTDTPGITFLDAAE